MAAKEVKAWAGSGTPSFGHAWDAQEKESSYISKRKGKWTGNAALCLTWEYKAPH